MKICKYCGGELIDSAVKCKHCGEWFDIICPYCEGEVSPQATICPHCGEKIKEGNEQETIQQSEYQNKKQNKVLIIVLFTILILIFVIFIGFAIFYIPETKQGQQHNESLTNNENYIENIDTKNLNNSTNTDYKAATNNYTFCQIGDLMADDVKDLVYKGYDVDYVASDFSEQQVKNFIDSCLDEGINTQAQVYCCLRCKMYPW